MFLGVDFGFGHIKYALSGNDNVGSCEVGKISSIVAEVQSDENDKDALFYEGKSYYVGELCAYQKNKNDIEKYEDLEKNAPLFLARIFEMNGVSPSEVESLAVCLAPIHYQHKDKFIKKIKSFEVNGVQYSFDNVLVLQQGACAKDLIEKKRDKKDNSSDYMIVDVGFNTLDVCVVLNGDVKSGSLSRDSVENYGVIKMANIVLNEVKSQINTNNITTKDAMDIIITHHFRFRGNDYDFSELVEKSKEQYYKEIKNYLEKNYETYIDRLQAIYLIGGGSYYVDSYENHFIKFSDSAEYFNALGCLLEAEKKPKKKK